MCGFSLTYPGTLNQAIAAATEALAAEGFGILTEIDVEQTLTGSAPCLICRNFP